MADSSETRFAVLFFTDIVGSTDLKARHGVPAYRDALGTHNRHFERLVREGRGIRILQNMGDGYFAEGDSVAGVVKFALLFQDAMREGPWGEVPLTTRVGIHAGEIGALDAEGGSGIVAPAADLAARVMSLAVGGQILLTRFPFDEARHFLREHPAIAGKPMPPLRWLAHGPYLLKGRDEPMEIFEVGAEGLAPLVAPPDGEKAKRAIRPGEEETLGWRPAIGLEIPGRTGWHLTERLGAGGFGEVWTGEHEKLRQRRAFKFCFDDERLRALKREVTLVRLLRSALGERDDIVRFHELKLDEPPFYLESDLAPQGNLLQWAERHGGLAKIPLPQRIALVAHTATALAAAHSIGVLHKDIKPTNILIFDAPDGTVRPRLVDFGIGTLADPEILAQQGITGAGFTRMTIQHSTGTPTYSPPEYLAGRPYTIQGDIYGLGVLLYQLVTAKPLDPLAPGWERDIADPLLREDIATCVDGDPARRFPSAADLAERLLHLDARRAAAEQEKQRVAALESRAYRRGVARTTALAFAVVAMVAALAAYAFHQARAARSNATRAESSARAESDAHGKSDEMLTKMQLQRAEELLDADDASGGLAYLAAVLRRHPNDQVTASRLLSALRDRSYARPLFKPMKHAGSVLALAWHPDGKRLVTLTKDRIHVWDTTTGQLVVPPIVSKPESALQSVRFSKDGRRFVVVGANAQVFDSDTAQPVSPPLAGGGIPYAIFFPDGKHIVTATRSKEIKVWEVETGTPIAELKIDSYPEALAVHPDGVRVAVCSVGGVILWDRVSQHVEQTWPRMPHGPGGSLPPQLVFSPTGTRLFEVERDLIGGYDLATKEQLPWKIQPGGLLSSFDLSPDGHTFAVVTVGHPVRFFSAQTGEYLSDDWRHGRYVSKVQYSASGTRFLSMTEQAVQVRTVLSGIAVCAASRVSSNIQCANLSNDGMRLAVGTEAGEVRLWEITASESQPVLFGPARSWPPCVLNSDESRIATSGGYEAIVWDFKSGRRLGIIDTGDSFWSLNFRPGSDTLLTAGLLQTWDSSSGKSTQSNVNGLTGCGGLGFSADGKLFIGGTRVIDFTTGQPVTGPLGEHVAGNTAQHRYGPQITMDGKHMVLVEEKKHAVKVFDVSTSRLAAPEASYEASIDSMTLNADGRMFAAGSTDGRVRVWRTADASPVTPWFQHQANVSAVSFSPDGSLLATASHDQTARVWSIPSGLPVSEPIQHSQPVLDVAFCPDGRRVATNAQDGSVRIWDAQTGRALSERLPAHVQTRMHLKWTRDGTHLLGHGAGLVHSWEAPALATEVPAWLADWGEAVAGQRLDGQGRLERVGDDDSAKVTSVISGLTGNDLYVRTAQWFYTKPGERTISPDSKITQAGYAQLLTESESSREAKAALHVVPRNARAWARYVELRMQNDDNNSFSATQVDEFNFLLSHAESLDPREPWVWRARGVLYKARGESEMALAAARHAAELDANDWRTQGLLGSLLYKKDENAAAFEAVDRALTRMELSGYDQRRRKQFTSLHYELRRRLEREKEAIPGDKRNTP